MRSLLLSLITILSLTACREGEAQDATTKIAEKPYKATTVDECIQEKECAWHAFKEIALDDYFRSEENQPQKYLPHWNEDIRVDFIGKASKDVKKNTHEDINLISNYFPHKISIDNQNTNILIVIMPDFNSVSMNHVENKIKNFIGLSEQKFSFISSESNRKKGCISIPKNDKSVVSKTIILVNLLGNGDRTCLRKNIYAALGLSHQGLFWLQLDDFQPSIENTSTVTNLHLLILKTYYSPDFHQKVNYETAKKKFNTIYPKVLKKYNQDKVGVL